MNNKCHICERNVEVQKHVVNGRVRGEPIRYASCETQPVDDEPEDLQWTNLRR